MSEGRKADLIVLFTLGLLVGGVVGWVCAVWIGMEAV